MSLRALDLDIDLDVFSGPFDLLMALILREEVDLLELDLAGVVLGYLDHIEARGALDLESATEFILLIAALLELKSRLMLPGEEAQELLELEPEQAAAELLERMLQVRRFQGAAGHLVRLRESQRGVRFRTAPVPAHLKRAQYEPPAELFAERQADPQRLARAIGTLLRMPPRIDVRHIHRSRVSVAERLHQLRRLLARGRFTFDEAVIGADRMTIAVTLYALLELYKRGEASWQQEQAFGEIVVLPIAFGEPAPADDRAGQEAAIAA